MKYQEKYELVEVNNTTCAVVLYKYKCKCGSTFVSHLKLEEINTELCPKCAFIKTIVNYKFEYLTILEQLNNNTLKCKCDCGNECIIDKNDLTCGEIFACPECMEKHKKLDIGTEYHNLYLHSRIWRRQGIKPYSNDSHILTFIAITCQSVKVFKVQELFSKSSCVDGRSRRNFFMHSAE